MKGPQPRQEYDIEAEVPIHVLDWGGATDGLPFIMLHGVGGNGWGFNALAPLLVEALGARYHIVSIDQRGNGDSGKPATGYHPADFAGDVLMVQDHLGGDRMTLVGHSRGGWIAAYVSGLHPDRVERTILLDPARITYATAEDHAAYFAVVEQALGPFPSEEEALRFAREREPRAVWSPAREEHFLKGYRRLDDGSLVAKMTPEVLREQKAARAVDAQDVVGPVLGDASNPALLVVATKSRPERQQQKLEYSKRMPSVRVEYLDSTHHVAYDRVEELAGLVTDFCGEDDRD